MLMQIKGTGSTLTAVGNKDFPRDDSRTMLLIQAGASDITVNIGFESVGAGLKVKAGTHISFLPVPTSPFTVRVATGTDDWTVLSSAATIKGAI